MTTLYFQLNGRCKGINSLNIPRALVGQNQVNTRFDQKNTQGFLEQSDHPRTRDYSLEVRPWARAYRVNSAVE